jgi:uncharacterized protein with PQ loop repeat
MNIHVSLVSVVGLATVLSSILSKVIGIPDQIRQNFTRKSTEGVSLANQTVTFIAYFFWTFYGLIQHDLVLIWGQALGVILTAVVLYQSALYRRENRHCD